MKVRPRLALARLVPILALGIDLGCRPREPKNPYADLPPPPPAESESQQRAEALEARAREASERAADLVEEAQRREREAAEMPPEADKEEPNENDLDSKP